MSVYMSKPTRIPAHRHLEVFNSTKDPTDWGHVKAIEYAYSMFDDAYQNTNKGTKGQIAEEKQLSFEWHGATGCA